MLSTPLYLQRALSLQQPFSLTPICYEHIKLVSPQAVQINLFFGKLHLHEGPVKGCSTEIFKEKKGKRITPAGLKPMT